MPRLRDSAGVSMFCAASKKIASPQQMRPRSGLSSPAIDISVVVLPQPPGPSSVTSSPCAAENVTSSRTRVAPKLLVSPRTCTSGTQRSPQHPRREREHQPDDGQLDD